MNGFNPRPRPADNEGGMSLHAGLLDRVMDLSPKDRADLARRIILSLEAAEADPDAARAWEAEIERRLAQIDRGEVGLLDWRQAAERVRGNLKRSEAG